MPFVYSACSLLSYGDADLQIACFDLIRNIGTTLSYDIRPYEKLILSVSAILNEAGDGLPVFRNKVYDTALGGCLDAVLASCPDDVIQHTAADVIYVFPSSLCKSSNHMK